MMKKYEGIAWIDISVRYLFEVVRLAAHVSNGLKSRIRPVVGRI